MTERGILFSGAMVRALLDGTKTQTRRAVMMPPSWDCIVYADFGNGWWPYRSDDGECPSYDNNEIPLRCPYGQVGDRLWVRETFFAYGRWETRYSEKKQRDEWHFVDMTVECDRLYQFTTDYMTPATSRSIEPTWHKRPAIHMPRAASRILLEIVSVRVERLQDISEADAIAEGVEPHEVRQFALHGLNAEERAAIRRQAAVGPYRGLWESINGGGSWDANPWVWVVEFRRVKS